MRQASVILLTACLLPFAPLNHTLAQSITPAPDGTGTLINYNGNTYHITGGTQAGANLFHSFQQFGLQPSEIADFLSNPAIQNVVGRVVGGDPSVIEGLIRLSGGNSNLFLVNPAGWVFTDGATVDVPGSFGVTTANRIGFGAGFFNATGENDYAALVGDPTSLIFDSSQPGAIINAADLNVSNGSLWMVGGSVISTGSITAPNGTVTLAAVPGESKVKLSHDGMTLSFFLDALAVDEVAPGTPLGIRAVDLPGFLNGSSEVGNANEVVTTENGELWLVGSQLRVEDGDVVVGNRVTAENVDLVAAGRVQVADASDIAGTTTVVRLPEADGPVSLNIIDRHADNADALLYGSAAGTISRIVENDEDGMAVITAQLAEISDQGEQLDGMSITAEGNAGNFWLGNTWINHENIAQYQDQLNQWAGAFKESADLLLYSCFTALGATGEALVESIATGTGLDVAASTNATGSANHSGDWALEYRTGEIELGNPFTAETLELWDGKLATFTVTTATQAALEAAIVAANGSAGADEIRFSGVTRIDLTSALSDITDELTITGGDTNVTIAGNNTTFRIFNVTGTAAATFDNLTITGGRTTGYGGGIYSNNGSVTVTNSTLSGNSANNGGGGIYSNNGGVTVTNSTVSGNLANAGVGGGILSLDGGVTVTNSTISGNDGGIISLDFFSDVTVTNSTISGNSSATDGGGIFSARGVTVTNSTISGNSADGPGGGIYVRNDATVTNSTISGNSANGSGGGIVSILNSDVTVTNSTVSGNSAVGRGGGILNDVGSISVTQSTISGNSVNGSGGGIYSDDGGITVTQSTIAFNSASGSGGGIRVRNGSGSLGNTIVSNNSTGGTGPDLFGTFTANYNLILDPSGATISGGNNIFGQDPLLLPLAFNNGNGTTQTHAIPANSPAINAGSNEIARLAGLTIEIFGGRVDLGAYELNPNNDVAPFTFAELFIDPLEDTENLTDEFLRTNSCQTIPEIELEKDDDADGEQIEEDLDATDGIDLDEDCLPINDSGGGGDVSAMERLINPVARRR